MVGTRRCAAKCPARRPHGVYLCRLGDQASGLSLYTMVQEVPAWLPIMMKMTGSFTWIFCGWSPRSLLLLVVQRGAFDRVALRIGSARGDRTGFAVRRHHDATGGYNLTALLDRKRERVIVDFLDGPRV